jgi:hypothetical protein
MPEYPVRGLRNATMSAICYEGVTVASASGDPATLAVVDGSGNVIESGKSVSLAAWSIPVASYLNLLGSAGYVRVYSSPPSSSSRRPVDQPWKRGCGKLKAPNVESLDHCIISGVIFEGLTITTTSGELANLAIVDLKQNLIEVGPNVAMEAWHVSIEWFRWLLKKAFYLREHVRPPTYYDNPYYRDSPLAGDRQFGPLYELGPFLPPDAGHPKKRPSDDSNGESQ